MTYLRHHPGSAAIAICASLVALWIAGGLATALVTAALADLALRAMEPRLRHGPPIGIRSDRR